MTDIYHALMVRDFSGISDEVLGERQVAYFAAAAAIDAALLVIGNLVLEADESEGYTDAEAKRDLVLIGTVLRSFPRMAQVLKQNGSVAEHTLNKRQGGAK
ncbi:TPA: hypothetical protein KEY88_004794 [Serratia marcescens]|uniref:Uncharacterized protein n=1 Tax=Serratia marcescens TaxID=615 RepID=A0A9X8VBG3_SERMA|nr:hypothetical protein [Serratia marcescens]MBS3894819.1 hypothetical protein [Serratia marcescens]HBC7422042.1 hypothetical protein [Serratia marcescens]